MATSLFDFVEDDRLRAGLEADHAEMQRCDSSSASKAVHVLAGSIVEAVLVDHLIVSGYSTRTGKDPLKLELHELITIAAAEGALSEKTMHLSHVIRGYRNLIHPGRAVRLGESINESTSRIAMALVAMITQEVAAKRQATRGYTAEQIADKLARDPSGTAVVRHLVRDLAPRQLEKLLLVVLPARLEGELSAREQEDYDARIPTAFGQCFRSAFSIAPDPIKRAVAAAFARLVREASTSDVENYGDYFFKGADVGHLDPSDRKLVIDHVCARARATPEGLDLLKGIPSLVTDTDEAEVLADVLARVYAKHAGQKYGIRAEETLGEFGSTMNELAKQKAVERVRYVARIVQPRSATVSESLNSIAQYILDDIPF